MRFLENISLKIFVRDDIWRRISVGGFTEASHITRTCHIYWDSNSLLNLIMLRLLNNSSFLDYFSLEKDKIEKDFQNQYSLMSSILPDKIDTGKNPATFQWMVSRIKDGLGIMAPRELIHLFECLKELQIKRLERGELEPKGNQLFDRPVFKEALSIVSKVRYEQTLIAEYPEMKKYTDELEEEKAEQTVLSLKNIWNIENKEATKIADDLVAIGFFEKRGDKKNPSYWVPFLYRDALNLIQGKAAEV